MNRFVLPALCAAVLALTSLTPSLVWAQAEAEALGTRAPETGLAVLDCAPPAPAPADVCVLRVPPGQTLSSIQVGPLGGEKGDFKIVRNSADLPGEGLQISATLVLVDMSRGPRSQRNNTWTRERDGIIQILRDLPPAGEVALYGFGDDLTRISDFTTTRSVLTDAMATIEPNKVNTLLAANALAAIKILKERENAILKNLIIISDGEEEGRGDLADVVAAAQDAGVGLSTLGMYWRRQGDAETSKGISVLRQLTDAQQSLGVSVFLRDAANVGAALAEFSRRYSETVGRSGVIVPQGTPVTSRLSATLQVPVPGVSGQTNAVVYRARFTPAAAADTPPPEETPGPETTLEDDGLLWGYPANYVYIAGAVIAALLLALLLLLVLRRRADEQPVEDAKKSNTPQTAGWMDDDNAAQTRSEPPAPVAPEVKRPIAYLMRLDTGERLAIRNNRVTIGRSSTADVVIGSEGVSRVHAEISRNANGGFTVSDHGSLNGTFVNGKKITAPKDLQIGDTLGFGKEVKVKLTLP